MASGSRFVRHRGRTAARIPSTQKTNAMIFGSVDGKWACVISGARDSEGREEDMTPQGTLT